jgi:NAD-dependent dihydropyrimidine dehydrogenase PreA subunit
VVSAPEHVAHRWPNSHRDDRGEQRVADKPPRIVLVSRPWWVIQDQPFERAKRLCEPECPVDAIKPDTEPGLEKWLAINAEYAVI